VPTSGAAVELADGSMAGDPFLIAYALAQSDRVVVTKEVSKPSKLRANRKVPDVCDDVGVKWIKDFDFFKVAGFSTK
jgi:uncharacterized protein DUF4411